MPNDQPPRGLNVNTVVQLCTTVVLTILMATVGYLVMRLDKLADVVSAHVSIPAHVGMLSQVQSINREIEIMRAANEAAHGRIEQWLKDATRKVP